MAYKASGNKDKARADLKVALKLGNKKAQKQLQSL
jgi:hypothetical protein